MPPSSRANLRLGLAALAFSTAGTAAQPAQLHIEIELPEPDTGPAYRPYLAAWIEGADSSFQGTLALWYDMRLRDNLGETFLRDLRKWWRRGGESLALPADAVSGPTRPPGLHRLELGEDHPVLNSLPPGDYVLAVEVTREDGGRDSLRSPFQWGAGPSGGEALGQGEVRRLALNVRP